jgi:hypothetical protein
MRSKPYLKQGRLADVLALIQVLAFDEHAHRSETGLEEEMQNKPTSGASWKAVAQEHPEFFRVRPDGDHTTSLVVRHVLPKDTDGRRVLPIEVTHKLLETAIELHDRQASATELKWKYLVPLLAALIGSAATLLTQWITAFSHRGCR